MNNVPTIHELRARGFKVRVMHERVTGFTYPTEFRAYNPAKLIKPLPVDPVPVYTRVTKEGKKAKQYPNLFEKGGQTTVEVLTPEGKTEVAVAKCNIKDPFNRKRGNHICLARLQKRGVI